MTDKQIATAILRCSVKNIIKVFKEENNPTALANLLGQQRTTRSKVAKVAKQMESVAASYFKKLDTILAKAPADAVKTIEDNWDAIEVDDDGDEPEEVDAEAEETDEEE